MKQQKRIRDYGISIGSLPCGERNAITDVDGVTVGHTTLAKQSMQTGVTAILPHQGNLFKEKVRAAIHVTNGYGKTAGSIQLQELGTIETPIILTNTLNVGVAADAVVRYMLDKNPDIGLNAGTVNPLVGECNDGFLNDIRGMHVETDHVIKAITEAGSEFYEGAVGAGRGMSCFQLKGGIGTASRKVRLGEREYTVGSLVLSNMGVKPNLVIAGQPVGKLLSQLDKNSDASMDKGSIIMLLATDAPLIERQLKRMASRANVGLIRTGSFLGNDSGDIAIAFTTKNRVAHDLGQHNPHLVSIFEGHIDQLFNAAAEATEEAIINSMVTAEQVIGRDGNTRKSLQSYMASL